MERQQLLALGKNSALKTEQNLEQACLVNMRVIYTFLRKLKSCLQKINYAIL